MADRPREPRAPVFVLSPARSCSSLVVGMLGQHPDLFSFPELRLMHRGRVGDLITVPPVSGGPSPRAHAAGLLRALAQLHEGRQDAEAVIRAWRWLGDHASSSCLDIMDHLLDLVAPLTGVEKSPETSRSAGTLRRVAQVYPRARFVHLVRHPWTTVASMVRAWSGLEFWTVPPERALGFCAKLWLEHHRRLVLFTTALGPDRSIRVRAEDVINEPERVLPGLCRWLGVDDGAEAVAAMSRPERSEFARPGPADAEGGLDASFLLDPRRRPVTCPGEPPGWVDPVLREQVGELARIVGYDASDDHLATHPVATGPARVGHRLIVTRSR